MFKIDIHSIVDVITNSSTVIYTYQDSVKETKELIQEVLNLMGENKTPDDIFYYGVFCDNDYYTDYLDEQEEDIPEDFPRYKNYKEIYGDYQEYRKAVKKWMDNLKLSVLKGEMEKPDWMEKTEEGDYDYWGPSTYIYLSSKDKRFENLAFKICSLLNSVTADGGGDG